MFGFSPYAQAPYASLVPIAYSLSVSESATTADSVSSGVNFISAFSESATAFDAVFGVSLISRAVSESASVSEINEASRGNLVDVSENATTVDSITGNRTIPQSISESATAFDSINFYVSTGKTYKDAWNM